MAKDVIVVVQRDALPTEKESLDILLVSTTGKYQVGTYRDIDSVKKIFGDGGPCPNAKIVRKATTLLNQGKTTLAETLVDKFKIVSFDPPSAKAATAAKFTCAFPDGDLEWPLESGTGIWVKVGGDSSVVLNATTSSKVTKWRQMAALFGGKTFTMGGKTYNTVASGTEIVATATEAGSADSIPAILNVYADEALTQEWPSEHTCSFVNGTDAVSAADDLVSKIKEFQADVDNDWYFFMTDRDEDEYVTALAKFAEASEPTEAELGVGVEDHRKFYMGQTANKEFASVTARAGVIYTDVLKEEADASYTGNVAPFYPNSVTWKFKRPQDGNAPTSAGTKLITLPVLKESERNQLLENHVNFLTEEYKRQYVKNGTCLDGEYIDVVLGADWIAKRMRDLLYDTLLENPNIDYDDAGFGLVGTAVVEALSDAVDYNIIAKDAESKVGIYTVNIPKYADSTEEQRANRVMPDITWEAQLAGAIHQVKTKGVLRASL